MRTLILPAALGLVLAGISCAHKSSAPTTQPAAAQNKPDRALKDPFGYKPDFSDTSIGGDTGKFDKEGLRKDIDSVLLR
jgi:hypothetical protein